jgi:hypothetical protein
MITLMAITAVAVVAAPVWAAGGRMLSDRQLDNVHAGSAVSDAHSADSSADSSSSGDLWIAGAASSAAAATASDVASARAVKIQNDCAANECKVKIDASVDNDGQDNSGANAQTIVNTVASVNAVQINVVGGAGGTQQNRAYTAEGAIGEIDSADSADSAASAASGEFTHFASADSSASAASTASSALAFATPRVEVKNQCNAGNCKLKIHETVRNNGDSNTAGANAQSILNTVASVNAVQINVAATGSTLQSNIAYSTLSQP